MALNNQDRVCEKSTTTGTGTYTLAGVPAITGFEANDVQTFAGSGVADADTVHYVAIGVDPTTGIPNNTGWESGLGTLGGTGTTLARTTLYDSSTGSAISWAAGTRFIVLSQLAAGTLVVQQPGGTAVDRVEILHNGSNASVLSKNGEIRLGSTNGSSYLWAGASGSGSLYHFVISGGGDLLFENGFTCLHKITNFVIGTNQGNGGAWLQNTPGSAISTSNATNATTTMANLTALSLTLISGRKYVIKYVIPFANSLAADGVKFDFNGGSAGMTSFRAIGKIFDAALLLSSQTTTLAGVFNVATATGDSVFECTVHCTPSGNGTLIPRFAGNSAVSGTVTVYIDSALAEDMP